MLPVTVGEDHARGYRYSLHLLEFQRRCCPVSAPVWLRQVATPLAWNKWCELLAQFPDVSARHYILEGISKGFRIGFDYKSKTCRSATSNMRSAMENEKVVQVYLDKEVSLQRIVGPVSPGSVPVNTQVSPFGVIPKASQPGKWRLIVDLSSPEDQSVNTGIEPELCSMEYLRLDTVINHISVYGRGTQMAKMDIESAYRIVPVHPDDRPLLGMQWIFFDTRLPFGLRSAPKIFSALADALQWIFIQQGVTWGAHYLDDFITLGPPGKLTCQSNLDRMLDLCRTLGVPVAPEKCAGPTSVLVFLGFEIDSNRMVVRLPQNKLQRLTSLISEWVGKRACKKRELQSLLGHLQHAATVVRPGRTFVRRLIELLSVFKQGDHWIRLNMSTRSDLTWWGTFIGDWNGISLMPSTTPMPVCLESDASGSWGCGATWGTQWFQWAWQGPSVQWSIAVKELLPILYALVLWGKQWEGQRIECLCDNMAVVAVINSGRAKDTILMHLLRCLFFVSASFQVQVHANHIPGLHNIAADALSRNNLLRFLQAVPGAQRVPASVAQDLVDLLVREQPDWTSLRWAQLFSASCKQV